MLRVLYRWVLRAHPSYFRQRFADEMQSIFDCARSPGAEVGLFVDGVLSLLRQWSLRPQFWQRPSLSVVADGAPLFHTLDNFKPRATALIYGAVLSAFALNGIVWTMGYAWNHPIFIEIKQPIISPPASRSLRNPSSATAPAQVEPWLYTNEGRVVLIFNAPVRAQNRCADQSQPLAPGQAAPSADSGPCAATPPSKSGMIF